MADKFVTVQLAPIFRNFQARIESLRDDILTDSGKTLRREEESSIRLRFYDQGNTLKSLQEEVVTEGNKKIYRLFPTATSKKGAPYPLFGEYGTGRRGATSGRPAPRGYRYGDSVGMKARRYSRIAVQVAHPLIETMAQTKVKNFAANYTVN